MWSLLQSETLTHVYEVSLLLVYSSALLLSVNWASTNRRRYRVERLYGAHPFGFTVRSLRILSPSVVLGSALGSFMGMLLLSTMKSVSVSPTFVDVAVITLGNGLVLTALFTVAVTVHIAKRERL